MNEEFKLRIYAKGELAMLYFPSRSKEAATRMLLRWIHNCKGLVKELKKYGYGSPRRFYTKKEVETIVKYLGEP